MMEQIKIEGGTYEVIRKRLEENADDLLKSLNNLNESRKEVFGSIETELVGTERISTENNCVPWDMFPLENLFIFGYNVHLGLKIETQLKDVFSIFKYENHAFTPVGFDLLNDKLFLDDFKKLYKYYKYTQFVRFSKIGQFLFMVFRIGKEVSDIKTFKWGIEGDKLIYIDNRSDHEFKYPAQHEFVWTRTTREQQVHGKHPHISIEDKVFVETVGGDLTIKVEDNTEDGQGIYREDVAHKDQTLDDGEIYYAVIGNAILLKIRPYQETFRYFVYNAKVQEVQRIDALAETCILLPDDHGIIFSNGYYLQTGVFKKFENDLTDMVFERRLPSPNGEDFLFVFYNRKHGTYLLLPYNLISQSVENPIICHGFSIFENGEMVIFRADEEPKKHHVVQIWKTPYVGYDFQVDTGSSSFLAKIGNKDVVRAMAECHEIITLIGKGDVYADLYVDLIKETTDVIDAYHWLGHDEAYGLSDHLQKIRETSNAAVDEFEKVIKIRENTDHQFQSVKRETEDLIEQIKRSHPKTIDDFVLNLASLRKVTGELISLEKLRYVDLAAIESYKETLTSYTEQVSRDCTLFLLKKESLEPYQKKAKVFEEKIAKVEKVVDANDLESQINKSSDGLKMLIEIVSNLKIDDATQTTRIIDSISAIYSVFNQIKAALKNKKQDLARKEGKAEFGAQLKLINQGVINYLDVSDSPELCDEYLTKILIQIEELEGKFSEFDEFITILVTKREEVYNAFESRKIQLTEALNKRAGALLQAADRILKAAQSRVSRFESVTEINGYFAADIMIAKARDIIEELRKIGDTVKSEDIESRLKSINEEAIRQLKDRNELFVDGKDLINFGKYKFTVNTQDIDLSIVKKEGQLFYHLSGTNFFEAIDSEELASTASVWSQEIISENTNVYRSEYLAYVLFKGIVEGADNALVSDLEALLTLSNTELEAMIVSFASQRFDEGYVKGVHDQDTLRIIKEVAQIHVAAELLRYTPEERSIARLWWSAIVEDEVKEQLANELNGAALILSVFPVKKQFTTLLYSIESNIVKFLETQTLFDSRLAHRASHYLFEQLVSPQKLGNGFVLSIEASKLYEAFNQELKRTKSVKAFQESIDVLEANTLRAYQMIIHWLNAYLQNSKDSYTSDIIKETGLLLLLKDYDPQSVFSGELKRTVEGLKGSHARIEQGTLEIDYHDFVRRLEAFTTEQVPQFKAYVQLKKELAAHFAQELRLNSFKPRVLSSFVRNQLIDEVYLPLIGANLAKQIGVAGEQKRTDLMGLLLLISPPGYGKTTLMEYIANRLGLVFMKINGPALGHEVLSIDPNAAPNAAASEELIKLNLSFEMGDNVMIYLDDIQHCNPEFLQKFISLCDAQRKIEGVYKGKTKTYDFRGKKVCVVMAGNPYTESGEKFRIPDMLSNRADIYNLGDMVTEAEAAFKMSYIENSLTSNVITARLANKSQKDVRQITRAIEKGSREAMDLEASHSTTELDEYFNLLEKFIKVRDVILTVNQAYIYSAGQADQYRTEPVFRLQGSYRDMNKMAEKLMPIMNEEEVDELILSHYQRESQTLTSGAEANMLKFKEMMGWMTEEEADRWESILTTFRKQQKSKGYGENNQFGLAIEQMESIADSLDGIKEEITATKNVKQKYKLLKVKDTDGRD